MAWLNLNKEFGFGWDSYTDWEETPEEEYMNLEEYNFYKETGSYLEDVNKPERCENLPFRESFRTREILKQRWDFLDHRSGTRVGNISIWKYAEMICEKNIGKSFDKTFSYYLKKTSHIHDRFYWFEKLFNAPKWVDYEIDEEGNIQEGKWWRWRSKPDKYTKDTPYLFKSYDLRTTLIHRIYGTEKEKNQPWTKKHRNEDYIEYVTSGYEIENVIPGSKLEKRLKHEYNSKRRQLERYWKLEEKLKEYSFYTWEEIKERKEKEEERWRLQKRGFDENSFKGEHYHGRKNKKDRVLRNQDPIHIIQ